MSVFFLRDLLNQFDHDRLCDLQLRCGPEAPDTSSSILCHRLVLAALSPAWHDLLLNASAEDSLVLVHLPDFDAAQVRPYLRGLYASLADGVDLPDGEEDVRQLFSHEFSTADRSCRRRQRRPTHKQKKSARPAQSVPIESLLPTRPVAPSLPIDPDVAAATLVDVKIEAEDFEGLNDTVNADEILSLAWQRQGALGPLPALPPKRPPLLPALPAGSRSRKRPATVPLAKDNAKRSTFYSPAPTLTLEDPEDPSSAPMLTNAIDELFKSLDGEQKPDHYGTLRTIFETNVGVFKHVPVHEPPLPLNRYSRFNFTNHHPLRGLVGIKATEKPNAFVGRVLTWPTDCEKTWVQQFENTCAVFKGLYGFSDLDMFTNYRLHRKNNMGPGGHVRSINRKASCRLEKMSHEVRMETVKSSGFEEASARGSDRRVDLPAASARAVSIDLVLDKDLQSFDDVVVLRTVKSSSDDQNPEVKQESDDEEQPPVELKFLGACESEEQRADLANVCMNALFDTLSDQHIELRHFQDKFDSYLFLRELDKVAKMLQTKDEDKDKRVCPDCSEIFPVMTHNEREAYRRHTRRHYVANYRCDCKDVDVSTFSKKKEHVMLVHSDGKYVRCETCRFYIDKSKLETHNRVHHSDHMCDLCGKVFKNKNRHDMHFWNQHKIYPCPKCDAELKGYHRLRIHLENHDGPFVCQRCKASFEEKRLFERHMANSTESRCQVTRKRQRRKPGSGPIQRRLEKNTGVFKCNRCEDVFESKAQLKWHRNQVHQDERLFECKVGCGARCFTEGYRKQHEVKKHGYYVEGTAKTS